MSDLINKLRQHAALRLKEQMLEWSGETDLIEEAADCIAELERQVAELRKDAERLKYMCQSGAHISWSMDGEVCNVWLPAERDGTEERPAEGYPQKCYYDWREAIDAALAQAKTAEKGEANG